MPKENGLFVFQKDTEPFQAELAFLGLFFLFFFPLICSFAISRQLLFKIYLNMYERLLRSHVHFDRNTNQVYDKTATKKS